MTPLAIAAKAAYESAGIHTWEEVHDKARVLSAMRAALLALAECDFPDRIEFQDGDDTVILHPNNGASKGLFRKFCRAIATEGKDNG